MPDEPTADPTGADRRSAIRKLLRDSEKGWLHLTEIAAELELDRSTVYHHAKVMVTEGSAATGRLRYHGEPGRPPTILLDIDRLHDIEYRFTDLEPHPLIPTASPIEHDAEILLTGTPDEWSKNPAAMGPVSRALADGETTDALVAALTQTLSRAILTDLRAGKTELVIRAVDPTTRASNE